MKRQIIIGPSREERGLPPLRFIDCPVCSAANGFQIQHTGEVCADGKPAFDPRPSNEYQVWIDEQAKLWGALNPADIVQHPDESDKEFKNRVREYYGIKGRE